MRARLGPLGAPLVIVLGWIAVRAAMLMPVPEGAAPQRPVRLRADAPLPNAPTAPSSRLSDREVIHAPIASLTGALAVRPHPAAVSLHGAPTPARAADEIPANIAEARTDLPPPFVGRSGTVGGYSTPARQPRRAFTGSGWALVNGTGGAVGVPSLGGSQAGMRVYLQGAGAPLALTARISRALGGAHDTEVSAGYAVRLKSFGLLVERRERLDVRSGAFAVTGYGGVYDVKLPVGLRFDGFAQGGLAGLRQRRWFADGQARVTAPVALSSHIAIGAGAGAWTSAQQGARRVEAGPLVEARVRAGAVGLRLAGEYRFRVTGDANPRSGPALTLGVDF